MSPGRAPRPGSTGSSPTASRKTRARIALCHLLSRERRRALRVHGLPRRPRSASTSSRPARSSATTTTRCASSCRRTAACRFQHDHDAVRRAGARRARARARCCRSSPTPTSPTPPSPGCRARRSSSARRTALRAARQLRRRARLRAAPSDRDAERDLRPADGRGRAIRHQAVRHPRDGLPAAGPSNYWPSTGKETPPRLTGVSGAAVNSGAHARVATTCLTSSMYRSAAASASSGVLPCWRALR